MSVEVDVENNAADVSPNDSSTPKLVKFRNATGITTTGALLHSKDCPRPGNNIGIYERVIVEESKAARHYRLMSTIIESSFMGQIAIGAAVTALGAADASYIGITVLGSLNTVIAGVQTYLKGQGLPNRIQQYRFGLRKLREHIEDLERSFSEPDCSLDVDKEVKEIALMYHAVRQTEEDNTPDTYKPIGGAGAKLLTKSAAPLENTPTGEATPEGISAEATTETGQTGEAGAAQTGEGQDTEQTPLLKK